MRKKTDVPAGEVAVEQSEQGQAAEKSSARPSKRKNFQYTPTKRAQVVEPAPTSLTETLRRCNQVNDVLKKEAIELELGTKGSLTRLDQSKSDPSAFSYWAELEFREYVRRQLDGHRTVTGSALVNGGARLLGVSPVTTKRYLGKLRAPKGPFSGLGDIVTINPHYVPNQDDEYWLDGGGDGK